MEKVVCVLLAGFMGSGGFLFSHSARAVTVSLQGNKAMEAIREPGPNLVPDEAGSLTEHSAILSADAAFEKTTSLSMVMKEPSSDLEPDAFPILQGLPSIPLTLKNEAFDFAADYYMVLSDAVLKNAATNEQEQPKKNPSSIIYLPDRNPLPLNDMNNGFDVIRGFGIAEQNVGPSAAVGIAMIGALIFTMIWLLDGGNACTRQRWEWDYRQY